MKYIKDVSNKYEQIQKGGLNMSTNYLNAAVAVDFSLIGTKLHAMYKKEEKGYKILLIPTLQADNEGVTIQQLIDDIKSLTKNVTGEDSLDTGELTNALNGAVEEGAGQGKDAKKINANEIRIILNMAYLYICKDGQQPSQVEYAFNLNILTKGLIPEAISSIVTVDRIGIAVWNTDRTQILNQMSIAKIEDYLGLPTTKAESAGKVAEEGKAPAESK